MADSLDPDQTPISMTSDLDLHFTQSCLSQYIGKIKIPQTIYQLTNFCVPGAANVEFSELQSPVRKKRKVHVEPPVTDTSTTQNSDSDTESVNNITPRATRSRTYESPLPEQKPKDKNKHEGKGKNKENEKQSPNGKAVTVEKTTLNKGGKISKSGKAGKASKLKSKININNVSSDESDPKMISIWTEKRPTPSMDYNESNAKCPLPGCDSKGNV